MKPLRISKTNKKLGGVCGAVAESIGVDVTLVRVLWALLTIISFGIVGVVAYVLCWLIFPNEQ